MYELKGSMSNHLASVYGYNYAYVYKKLCNQAKLTDN